MIKLHDPEYVLVFLYGIVCGVGSIVFFQLLIVPFTNIELISGIWRQNLKLILVGLKQNKFFGPNLPEN